MSSWALSLKIKKEKKVKVKRSLKEIAKRKEFW